MSDSIEHGRSDSYLARLSGRWQLPLLLAILSALFAWVYIVSIGQAQNEKASQLSLELSPSSASAPVDLELATRLNSRTDSSPAERRPSRPAPWWPALLFALAFCGGWSYRHLYRSTSAASADSTLEANHEREAKTHTARSTVTSAETAGSHTRETPNPTQLKSTGAVPDLAHDFPWDESALDDSHSLTSEERIARLETQNASKAEIIKALEKLVTENREKWLHQDETEARLNSHISELSADLQVAIRQLQRLQDGTRAQPLASRKDAV